jgi:SAM-dependent methyltransferase
MAKAGERTYFKEIGDDGMAFTLNKPFSDAANIGSLLHDIAAVFTLLPPAPARILDLGCGSGWTSAFYARAGYEVVGVDIAPEAIDAAQKEFASLKTLSFKTGDYDELLYENEFDAVIFFDSLHHAEDENIALAAAYRALKPGGRLVACEPGVGHSKTPKSIEAMEHYGVNERDMPPKYLRPRLSAAGFTGLQTYAYPAIAHRALYVTRDATSLVGRVRNWTLARALTTGLLATLLKRNHGIVLGYKNKEERA